MPKFCIALALLLYFTSILLLIIHQPIHHIHYFTDPPLQTTILIPSNLQPLGQSIDKLEQSPQPLILFLHCLKGHPFSVVLFDLPLNETDWIVEEGRAHLVCDYGFSVFGRAASDEQVYSFGLCDYFVLLCYYFFDEGFHFSDLRSVLIPFVLLHPSC